MTREGVWKKARREVRLVSSPTLPESTGDRKRVRCPCHGKARSDPASDRLEPLATRPPRPPPVRGPTHAVRGKPRPHATMRANATLSVSAGI